MCGWLCDIMAGQRGQREMEGVETQRYSLAFIITILPRAQREREREAKIDARKRKISGGLQRRKEGGDGNLSLSSGLENHCSVAIAGACVCRYVVTCVRVFGVTS